MISPSPPNRCPVCGATGRIESRYPEAGDYVSGDVFAVLACGWCGIAFTHPAPCDMARYYPPTYRAYRGPILGVLDMFYGRKARKWTRMFDKPGRVLEIGCGPGIMLRSMRSLGWEVTGLERSEDAAAYGRREFGLKILAGGVEDLPAEQRFDFIILFQVLEHMPDPSGLLAECFRRLGPGGRIAIGVPNSDSWQARFGADKWVHLDVPRHLFHFSPKSLEFALGRSGFCDIRFDYVSFEHDPFGWIQTCLNRAISPPNTMLRYLMKLEADRTKVTFSLAAGTLLALSSLVLSMASWAARRGAIVSATASRP